MAFARPRTDRGVEMREMMVATHDRARGRCGADQLGGGSWQKFPFSDGPPHRGHHGTQAMTWGPFGVACCCFVDQLQGTWKDLKQTRQRVPCILSLFRSLPVLSFTASESCPSSPFSPVASLGHRLNNNQGSIDSYSSTLTEGTNPLLHSMDVCILSTVLCCVIRYVV